VFVGTRRLRPSGTQPPFPSPRRSPHEPAARLGLPCDPPSSRWCECLSRHFALAFERGSPSPPRHPSRRDLSGCRLYCGASFADVPITVDHVVPVVRGGSDGAANLATACEACNREKGVIHLEAYLLHRELTVQGSEGARTPLRSLGEAPRDEGGARVLDVAASAATLKEQPTMAGQTLPPPPALSAVASTRSSAARNAAAASGRASHRRRSSGAWFLPSRTKRAGVSEP
jgi:HNH endonuclease